MALFFFEVANGAHYPTGPNPVGLAFGRAEARPCGVAFLRLGEYRCVAFASALVAWCGREA
jgi:hypothetical protein